ncbi:MAG: hypothetical protein ACLR17_03470 [Enterobacteriaceae bacterium]
MGSSIKPGILDDLFDDVIITTEEPTDAALPAGRHFVGISLALMSPPPRAGPHAAGGIGGGHAAV